MSHQIVYIVAWHIAVALYVGLDSWFQVAHEPNCQQPSYHTWQLAESQCEIYMTIPPHSFAQFHYLELQWRPGIGLPQKAEHPGLPTTFFQS